MRSTVRLWLPFLLLLPFLFQGVCAAEPVRPPVYQITGVAVSSRDGSRIPYCKFEVTEGQPLTQEEITPKRASRGDRPEGGPQRFRGQTRQTYQTVPEFSADVHGRFTIDLPGPGRWRVRGFSRNFRLQDYDVHDTFFSSIVLTPSTPAMDVVFKLVPDAAITGLIRDEAGDAIRNAQVVAEYPSTDQTRGAWRSAGFAQTDDRGRYEISGLAPGAYRLRVQAQPWYAQAGIRRNVFTRSGNTLSAATLTVDPALDVVYAPTWFPGVDEETRAEPIQLTGGEERQADFQLLPIPATHLKVPRTDPPAVNDGQPRPQRNAIVTKVSPAGGNGPSFSTTNGNETDFGGLSPGVYEVRQVGADGRPEDGVRQFRVLPGTGGVVDLGTTQSLVRVRVLADGVAEPQLNEVLFLDTATGRSISSNSDRMQMFDRQRQRAADAPPLERLAYLAAGTYEVYLPTSSTNVLTGLSVAGAKATGSIMEISDGSPTLTLHLAAGKGKISGRVLTDGKPSAGTMVLLVPATLGQPGSLTPIRRDQTDTDGGYSIRTVLPGRYIVVAIQNGWGLKWQDPATLIRYLGHGSPVEITPDGKQTLDLTPQTP